MIGHLLGAAGGAELVTCVKELQEGFIHQTIGTETPGEGCDLNYVLGAPVKKEIRYAMSNSLGFGGHNATLLIKNSIKQKRGNPQEDTWMLRNSEQERGKYGI